MAWSRGPRALSYDSVFSWTGNNACMVAKLVQCLNTKQADKGKEVSDRKLVIKPTTMGKYSSESLKRS